MEDTISELNKFLDEYEENLLGLVEEELNIEPAIQRYNIFNTEENINLIESFLHMNGIETEGLCKEILRHYNKNSEKYKIVRNECDGNFYSMRKNDKGVLYS